MKTITFIGCLCLSVMFAACGRPASPQKPANLIDEDVYVSLMAEIQLIKTHFNAERDSVNVDSLKQLVYNKYGVSDEQYIASNTFYQQQVENQLVRVQRAIELLKAESERIDALLDSIRVAEGDSIQSL